MTDRNKSRSKK
ncbi:hypothetical protein D030_0761A, partial [Vibrio parahaemolyticus AQ3810]